MKIETVAEQLLFATLRIEATRHGKPNSVGTGFIVGHEWTDDKGGPFLVTNRHVIEETETGHLAFTLAKQDGDNSVPQIGQSTSISLEQNAWKWTVHPSADVDLAVLPLAPVVNHLSGTGNEPFYKSIPTRIIPDVEVVEDFDAVEEVLFVGYPSGIYDRTNNLPIARRGTTATHPSIDYDGRAMFLIDASVFPGSSGSPVLIYDKGSWQSRDGVLMAGQRVYLLGVLGGAYYREDDGSLTFQAIPTTVKPVVKTTQMIDLGVVYKARTIVETIEHLLHQHGELPVNSPKIGTTP